MADLIDRQDVIDAFDLPIYNIKGKENAERVIEYLKAVIQRIKDLPSAQPEHTKMIKEIRKWINSGNRGNADYFIVDKIEEIINKYE